VTKRGIVKVDVSGTEIEMAAAAFGWRPGYAAAARGSNSDFSRGS